MLNVALTGNIAAGKSTVVAHFQLWGATIIDADRLAREAQAPGGQVLAAIARRFGADVLAADGSLDRETLRGKVMGDQAALEALNAIVHPAVRRRREELLRDAATQGDVLVVNDIPLLFEVLDPAQFDAVVLVDAPVAMRRARLRTGRGLSEEEADRMIAAQMPAERKRGRSAFTIDNEGSLKALERRAWTVFEELRRQAARAALGRPAKALALVTPDAKDAALEAIGARYADAGLAVRHLKPTATALEKLLERAAGRPDAVVAAAPAAQVVADAWVHAGRPGVCAALSPDPDPVAVRLDLRPWGHERVRLVEPDGAGVMPRPDLFPSGNPLP